MKNTQTITHKAKTYTFPVVNGSVQIPKIEILGILDAVKLLLYFYAGCGLCRIEKTAFTLISRAVREWLDYEEGGLNANGAADFVDDHEVLDAANKHKAHLAKRRTVQTKPESRTLPELNVRPEGADSTPVEPAPNIQQIPDAPDALEITMVPVDQILSNPHNSAIYDEALNPALLASVEEHGILVPIRLTLEYVLVDGHQRVMAAKESEHKVVPAIFVDLTPETHLEQILEYNRYREKTIAERLREYRSYLRIEKAKAAERAGLRTDLGHDLAPGENYGKSRDHAAKKVNLSGTSADLGLRVLEEIEKQEKSGKDKDGVARVKVALAKSILGAAKLAQQIGWMDTSVKNRPKKHSASSAKDDSKNSGSPVADDSEAEILKQEPSEDAAVRGWLTDELIEEIVAEEKFKDTATLKWAIRRIRPSLYLEFGTSVALATAPKIHQLAQALVALARKCEELNQ